MQIWYPHGSIRLLTHMIPVCWCRFPHFGMQTQCRDISSTRQHRDYMSALPSSSDTRIGMCRTCWSMCRHFDMDSSCSDPWWVGRWDSQLDSRALQPASAVPWYVVYRSCQSRRRRSNLLLNFDYCCWADFHPLIARDALEFHRVRVSCFSVFSLHRVNHRFRPNPSWMRWMRSWQERAVSAHRTRRWKIDFCLAIWWKYFSIRQTRRRDCRRSPVSLVWQKEKK